MQMRTWTFPERRPPIRGPWDDEPDKAQWIDPATGLDCLIVRSRWGALCGYVGLPPGHPWHGRGKEFLWNEFRSVRVHGGVTFAGPCMEGAEDGPGVCHVPEPGRPAEVWWLGFDCGHGGDYLPIMDADLTPGSLIGGLYRTFDYVQDQVTKLAAQLHRREEAP